METAVEKNMVFHENGQPIASEEIVQAKRNVRTKIFVLFKLKNEIDLKSFDFKSDLDTWLTQTGAEVLRVVRGSEKEIKKTNTMTFV